MCTLEVMVAETAATSADYLLVRWIQEARHLGVELDPYGEAVLEAAEAQLVNGAWCSETTRERLTDVEIGVETSLATRGYFTEWDGGFVIYSECGNDNCEERV